MKSDIQIAQEIKLKHILEISKQLNIADDDVELYGKYKAKLPLKLIDENKIKKSKLILVTAITPTPAGEGKTTTSIGLAQAMNLIGKKTTVVLREPSLGPVFGIKGGATGGGFSQVLPMEDINLHFTGDLSAVEKAHNLLAALIDNNLQNEESNLHIDPRTVSWKRVIDMNDRALRSMIIGLGGVKQGVPRETGFDITAASEVMATLCLSKDLDDLKQKLGNIFVGYTYEGKPIFARDLKAQGAMTALLKDAIKPNLVQTVEGTPAIIHGGPFANIAQGTNTIIATKMGLSLSDYVVTEAGFASELGAEKFFDIKCQYGNLTPNAAVLVATIRALKYHGGAKLKELKEPNVEALKKGLENLDKHIENLQMFNFKPTVAINKFITDSAEEVAVLKEHCEKIGIKVALVESWEFGGKGAVELANMVVESTEGCETCFKPLYKFESEIEDKINTIATKMYGAKNVEYSSEAKAKINKIKELGLGNLPICIAKTQKSLSDDQNKKGRPRDFTVKIREVELSSGAGFIVPIAGAIMRMPGLPEVPAAEMIDIDNDGNISGLF
ncbi:MAG TPA: formate--tetrahydrofolate ligase [Bacteroidales bacterium]|nr:MAG: formate--tetrahydrofolate ligase [Bacteroidetes bacterium GWF2_33_38]OFY85970.1 MAG: formate--tetrahydrofolate ligase [Bacteroidetes bacterium RIFOXYA2_FULL_33_7]HBF88747.1 formate--tetrahydrofolate ligase [Bacteroidales bacterium]